MLVPNYYKDFLCIADKCRHSCCIGWEIDIDDETLRTYKNFSGEIADRMKENISICDGQACFKLDENERCPFLSHSGLCDIISQYGQDAVPYICREHPRFYNEFSFCTEAGLGLCCEEACRLILSQTEKTELIALQADDTSIKPTEEEIFLLSIRKQMFDTAQMQDLSFEERLEKLTQIADIEMPYLTAKMYCELYLSLERLDDAWEELLSEFEKTDEIWLPSDLSEFDTAFEKLTVYLIFRHLAGALYNDDLTERICFCIFSVKFIRSLCAFLKNKNGNIAFEEICDICRMYSSEIEYSEDNTAAMLDYFKYE